MGNQYNIRTIFKTKHKLRSSLMKTRPERDLEQMAQCIYSISCECGSCPFLRLALSKGPNRVGVPTLEDENKSIFRNVVFYSF
jgi:hypothetical protein